MIRRIAVFAGPSLPPPVRPPDPRLLWLPPARAGDGLALDPQACDAVVLIDGRFDAEPAIRHKELLVLLARTQVVGGASMGALRAAELRDHGMIGVGRIYRAYASGRWVGDDEVALLHGPEDMDWRALTTPLVNVRATLVRAVRARVLAAGAARRWLKLAAGIFYQDRTWPFMIAAGREGGLNPREVSDFAAWLPSGAVDLKRADALQAVSLALTLGAPPPRPPPPATSFTAALAKQLAGRPPPG